MLTCIIACLNLSIQLGFELTPALCVTVTGHMCNLAVADEHRAVYLHAIKIRVAAYQPQNTILVMIPTLLKNFSRECIKTRKRLTEQ